MLCTSLHVHREMLSNRANDVISLGVNTDGEAVEHVAVGVGGPQLPLAVTEAQAVQAGRGTRLAVGIGSTCSGSPATVSTWLGLG